MAYNQYENETILKVRVSKDHAVMFRQIAKSGGYPQKSLLEKAIDLVAAREDRIKRIDRELAAG